MEIKKLLEELDALYETKTDDEIEAWLAGKCAELDAAAPEERHARSALYNELGGFYRARGVYDKGEAAFLKAKDILEEDFFEDVELPASACASCSCCSCGDDGSENAPEELVKTKILTNCRDSLDYATTLNNLAGLYRLWGQLDSALDMFDEARAVYDAEGGAPADVYASCLSNKGLVYLDKREADKAMELFTQALGLLEGADYEGAALGATYSNMAFADLINGNNSAAGEKFRIAAEHFLKANGDADEGYRFCADMAGKLGAK